MAVSRDVDHHLVDPAVGKPEGHRYEQLTGEVDDGGVTSADINQTRANPSLGQFATLEALPDAPLGQNGRVSMIQKR